MFWEVVPEKSHDHWLQLKAVEGPWTANVKRDGCIDIQRYHESPDGELTLWGSHHICDLRKEMRMLAELAVLAVQHFGTDWLDQ